MGTPDARDTDQESVRTARDVMELFMTGKITLLGMFEQLGLDPDTVLDGPLVVLHPGQHVVEGGDAETFPGRIYDAWLIASNPQEMTP